MSTCWLSVIGGKRTSRNMGEDIWFAFDIQRFNVGRTIESNSLSLSKSIFLPMYKLSGISSLDNVKEMTQNYTYQLDSPIGLDLELLKRALKGPWKKMIPECLSFRLSSVGRRGGLATPGRLR